MMRAASAVDPTGMTSLALKDKLVGLSPQEIANDVAQYMRSTSSPYVTRAASFFMEDIQVLEDLNRRGISTETIDISKKLRLPRIKKPTDLSTGAWKDISGMKSTIGAGKLKVSRFGRADWGGSELHITLSGGNLKGMAAKLKVPGIYSSKYPNIVTRGHAQQSRYLAGMFGIIEDNKIASTLNWEEFMIRRANEELVPQIMKEKNLTQRRLNHIVHNFETDLARNLDWVQSVPRGVHEGWSETIKARSSMLRVFERDSKKGLVPISQERYHDIISRGGMEIGGAHTNLYPAISPKQIPRGIFMREDLRGSASLIASSEDISRYPMQFLRREYAPTQEALWQMKYMDPASKEYAWAGAKRGVAAPMVRTAYVSSKYASQLHTAGVTTEGMGLLSRNLRDLREVEEIATFDVGSISKQLGAEIDPSKGTHWKLNKIAPAGTFLGRDPTGRPVTLRENMQLLEAVGFPEDKNKGSFIRVIGKRKVPATEASKVYLGGKIMAWEAKPQYIRDIMEKTLSVPHLAQVDAIVTMDELKKNRRLHYNQLFTSLHKHVKANMSAGLAPVDVSEFINDPLKAISRIEMTATFGGSRNDERIIQSALSLARGGKLSPHQMGLVFGAVPDVFGEGWQKTLPGLAKGEISEVRRGIVEGFTQFFYGGPGGSGAGGMGTIEPRVLELLDSPHWGRAGAGLFGEISERMIQARPERLLEQEVLGRSLDTITSPGKLSGALQADTILRSLTGEQLLSAEDQALRISGIGDIMIPGQASISQLAPYQTATGFIAPTELIHDYRSVLENARLYDQGKLTRTAMQEELGVLATSVARAKDLTVTGKGGLARGRLPGSKFLTAVTPAKAGIDLPDPYTIGIGRNTAKDILKDIRQFHGNAAADELWQRLEAGESIAGASLRHPAIGPYSMQPSKYKLVDIKGDYAVINEQLRRVTAQMGNETADLGLMRFSPLVGQAGDTDADIISAILASPKLEKQLASHIADPENIAAYEAYQIRSQVLKAKAKAGTMTLQQEMAGAAAKLGIPQTQVGIVSTHLAKARSAVMSSKSLSANAISDALGLLEWMEQTPISGKHIASDRALEMIDLFNRINQGFSSQNANVIADTSRQIMAQADIAGQKALRDGFRAKIEDVASGSLRDIHIRGIGIQDTSRNIVDAMAAQEATIVGDMSAAKRRQLMFGQAKATLDETRQMFKPHVLQSSPLGSLFIDSAPPGIRGSMAKAVSSVLSFKNQAASMGRKLIQHARPLAIGTGAAVGLATLLSEPPKLFAPGETAAPIANMRSGTGGANIGTNIHPDSSVQGSPTVADHTQAMNSVRLATGKNISIDGSTKRPINYSELNQQIRQAVGRNTQVNSIINDNRTSLTPQKLSDILNS